MHPIIQARDLGKQYCVQHNSGVPSLRDAISRRLTSPFKRNTNGNGAALLWALRNVSFEVQSGEVIGVIGRNGAGKSTLLKILSRVIKPTVGAVDVYGRVGSLLEIGTGFHPDLTGRENVYLNGAIIGMKRREIQRKFDEIVTFAEVEHVLDTPVRYYSTGMYLRLAFAVAGHFEPEILLLDEVLAVGDAAFQKKCLDKMKQISSEGRTVFFVSHNLSSIKEMCSRALLVEAGQLIADGSTEAVSAQYLRMVSELDS